MPGEVAQTPGAVRKRVVAAAEFREFMHALDEFHSEVDHGVINGLRDSKNAKIAMMFSDADEAVLTIGGTGAEVSAALSVGDSPPSSPLAVTASTVRESDTSSVSSSAAAVESRQLPPRSNHRGKLRARDSNASVAPQQEGDIAAANRGKRQRTSAAAAAGGGGQKEGNYAGAAAVPKLVEKEDTAKAESEMDKENQPAAVTRGRGRPPLHKRNKADNAAAGGRGGAAPAAAAADAATGESRVPPDVKPTRRSERNSGLPPSPQATRRTRSSSSSNVNDSSPAGGDGSNSSSSNSVAVKIAELRAVEVSSMKVVDLKAALRRLGAPVGGLKAVLQARLEETVKERINELEASLPPPAAVESSGEVEEPDVKEEEGEEQQQQQQQQQAEDEKQSPVAE
ncbi:unnamed protein product, partial [Scytosiphon promiscuus]